MAIRRVAQLRSYEQFTEYCESVGASLPVDAVALDGEESPLAQPYVYRDKPLTNRFAILPMEGWDGTVDGHPSDLTRRRWQRFGRSGAKLIWGGEAVAVRHDGRANARQLVINDDTAGSLASLRCALADAHAERFGAADDLLIGLATHALGPLLPAEQRATGTAGAVSPSHPGRKVRAGRRRLRHER